MNRPFLLKPSGKDYLWGGQRLNTEFEKNIDMDPLAETWECSTHPDGPSYVATGEFAGLSLTEVIERNPEILGTRHKGASSLPVLIKLIDAKRDLSVQVHPDDTYAAENENGQLGKTEMWYVLDAGKDASIIYGLYNDIGREELRSIVEDGRVEKYLQRVSIHKGDQFFIKPGTIHAIGAGALIAEIQENSNLTYRLYDYNRVDKSGKKRPLHIDKALDVANLSAAPEPRQPMRVFRHTRGCASETLCRCKYFQAERLLINTEQCRQMASLQTDSLSFQVLLCVGGCGSLFYEKENLPFFKGDCIFMPADSLRILIHGKAEIIRVLC